MSLLPHCLLRCVHPSCVYACPGAGSKGRVGGTQAHTYESGGIIPGGGRGSPAEEPRLGPGTVHHKHIGPGLSDCAVAVPPLTFLRGVPFALTSPGKNGSVFWTPISSCLFPECPASHFSPCQTTCHSLLVPLAAQKTFCLL